MKPRTGIHFAAALAGLGFMLTPSPRESAATLVLAGGCFWGVEAVFEHVRGVQSVTSGFARPADATAEFVPVEAVRVVYDPSVVTPSQLLAIFYTVAHDPTSRDRQGPDAGAEYRAIVFFQSDAFRGVAEKYAAELTHTKQFVRPLVTELRPLGTFAVAESFHQDYSSRHPNDRYVVINDVPKVAKLKERYPALYQEQRAP